MGCCFSSDSSSDAEEIEMKFTADTPDIKVEDKSTANVMSMYMEDKNCLTSDGEGSVAAAMAPVVLEQDKCYWEIQVDYTGKDEDFFLYAGVSKKNDVAASAGELSSFEAFSDPMFLVKIPDLKRGDTVGVCFDQSDLPMLVFRVNNEITSHHVTRVKGSVHPFVAFTSGSPDQSATTTAVSLVFKGKRFKGKMPQKFDAVLAASNLI
jgi:hypothetical protein